MIDTTDIFINLDTKISDLINFNSVLPIILRLEVEDKSVKVYAANKEVGETKPSFTLITADSIHAITRHSKKGANLTQFIKNEESKAKFSKIGNILQSNNISTKDIENYLNTLNKAY